MSHVAKLARAIEIADELLNVPGDNSGYYTGWRATKAEWQSLYDSGEYRKGANLARDKFRHLFVQCSDWREAKEPYGGGPWSMQAAKFSGYLKELDVLCPMGS